DELRSLLSDDEYLLLARHYGVDRPPNFENRLWHLAVAVPIEEVAASLGLSPEDARSRLDGARHKLLLARERRVRPGRDDKVLTGWNALMIRGLARAARIFGRADWRAAAQAAVDSVNATLWRDGRLLATCKDGRAHLDAYLDDHAWLLAALLEMMEDEFRPVDLAFAQDIADALVDSFQDTDGGGFFFTRDDHERLILRPKSGHDNATPAGNGVAAWALGRLGHLTGEQRYLDAAEHTLQAFYAEMRASPAGYASMATALGEWLAPPAIVVVRGPTEALLAWRRKLGARFRPSVAALVLGAEATGLPPVLDKPVPYIVNAWVCRGVKCLPAVSDWESLDALLPEIGKAGDKD
ncbi:MAG: thioredoxin domain-containing protein, partial [Zoogloea sp.]|nr:thioredoxin domain-containing protein [Zoogloea sp.]